jgi:hypothetical protein
VATSWPTLRPCFRCDDMHRDIPRRWNPSPTSITANSPVLTAYQYPLGLLDTRSHLLQPQGVVLTVMFVLNNWLADGLLVSSAYNPSHLGL